MALKSVEHACLKVCTSDRACERPCLWWGAKVAWFLRQQLVPLAPEAPPTSAV